MIGILEKVMSHFMPYPILSFEKIRFNYWHDEVKPHNLNSIVRLFIRTSMISVMVLDI